jgi:hypothetical protein
MNTLLHRFRHRKASSDPSLAPDKQSLDAKEATVVEETNCNSDSGSSTNSNADGTMPTTTKVQTWQLKETSTNFDELYPEQSAEFNTSMKTDAVAVVTSKQTTRRSSLKHTSDGPTRVSASSKTSTDRRTTTRRASMGSCTVDSSIVSRPLPMSDKTKPTSKTVDNNNQQMQRRASLGEGMSEAKKKKADDLTAQMKALDDILSGKTKKENSVDAPNTLPAAAAQSKVPEQTTTQTTIAFNNMTSTTLADYHFAADSTCPAADAVRERVARRRRASMGSYNTDTSSYSCDATIKRSLEQANVNRIKTAQEMEADFNLIMNYE